MRCVRAWNLITKLFAALDIAEYGDANSRGGRTPLGLPPEASTPTGTGTGIWASTPPAQSPMTAVAAASVPCWPFLPQQPPQQTGSATATGQDRGCNTDGSPSKQHGSANRQLFSAGGGKKLETSPTAPSDASLWDEASQSHWNTNTKRGKHVAKKPPQAAAVPRNGNSYHDRLAGARERAIQRKRSSSAGMSYHYLAPSSGDHTSDVRDLI